MRILAFDTATRATAVALCGLDGGPLDARDDPPPGARPGHAKRLLPLALELLERAHSGWADIERIAVGVGPGTFTGLRIGISTARALARAREIPLVGVSTLASLALNAVGLDRPFVAAVIDARRGEVFAAAWRLSDLGSSPTATPILPPAALAPEKLAATLADAVPGALAIGDGAVEFRAVLERSGALIPPDASELHGVRASNHCLLARGQPGSAPGEVRPEYLRLPDAEIARRASADP
jgi:tRNA threonylcarbamoyladenosine biosynthesis protein TsaB